MIFSQRQKSDSVSPSATRTTLHPDVNAEFCGASCCNRAVPFISVMVLPCFFNVYVGLTTLLCVPVSRLDVHVAAGTCLRTILSQRFWVWVKEADLNLYL